MRLIDADDLKESIENIVSDEMKIDDKWATGLRYALKLIDNAPTADTTCPNCDSGYAQGYSDGYLTGKEERPQEEKEHKERIFNPFDHRTIGEI